MSSKSTLRAALIAPLATVPCVAVSLAILPNTYYGVVEPRTVSEYVVQVLVFSAFAVPIAFAAVIVLGMPLRFLLWRVSFPTFVAYILFSVTIASLIFWRLAGGFSLLWQLLAISCSLSVAFLFAHLIGDTTE